VLIKVDKFYFPVGFIVIDTEPVHDVVNQIPVILGRPFLATVLFKYLPKLIGK
jgi:hypothetical protein